MWLPVRKHRELRVRLHGLHTFWASAISEEFSGGFLRLRGDLMSRFVVWFAVLVGWLEISDGSDCACATRSCGVSLRWCGWLPVLAQASAVRASRAGHGTSPCSLAFLVSPCFGTPVQWSGHHALVPVVDSARARSWEQRGRTCAALGAPLEDGCRDQTVRQILLPPLIP